MNDPTTAPLFAEIERLQQELDHANESIDEKLDRLEDAGVGVVQLTNQLEDTKAKILALENALGHLSRREERRLRRLEKLRCQKCRIRVDLKGLTSNVGDERYVPWPLHHTWCLMSSGSSSTAHSSKHQP